MALGDLAGFGVRGYRSFGSDEIARFGPMSKVHLVVGRNDVGKSNVLNAAYGLLRTYKTSGGNAKVSDLFPEALDQPENWDNHVPQILSVCFRRTDAVRRQFGLGTADSPVPGFATEAFTLGDPDKFWLDLEVRTNITPGTSSIALQLSLQQFTSHSPEVNLAALSAALTNGSSSDAHQNLGSILEKWAPWTLLPPMMWVDAVREVSAVSNGSADVFRNGRGLIQNLADLQNPEYETRTRDSKKWNDLQEFVRDVLDDASAKVEIPRKATTILVHRRNGDVKPLEKVGTGISEVIFLAAVATSTDGHLICIEEPESHLHPTLQRKLIQYLHQKTNNRYLVSSHSAALVNSGIASVSHLEMRDGWTRTGAAITPGALAAAAADLGNRPSDLVQSNFIAWVEGPSDRTYVRHWIGLADPDLVEGAHYTIMFYGGALLSHLSAAEDTVAEDFIELLRINRNLAVVMDSDKSSVDDPLNATKERVIAELDANDQMAWVTHGYTIENYVPRETLESVISERYPKRAYEVPASKFASPLGGSFDGTETRPSKVAVANMVVERPLGLEDWGSELAGKAAELCRQIRKANGLPQLLNSPNP